MKFGIIGCGKIGQKRAETLKGHEIKVVCDSNVERAYDLAHKYITAYTTDWKDVVKSDVDAIIVSTTNDLLVPIALEAAKNGKHVLIEKPGARNSKELEQLLEYHDKVKIKVGYNLQYHPAIDLAKKIFFRSEIGELMFVRGRYGHGGRIGYEKEWRFSEEISGGGELIDQGVHLIDLAGAFLGDFTEINGDTKTYFWDMKLDDNAFLNLKTSDGKTAFLHVSCTEWKNTFCFEIYGKKGKLQIDGLGGSYGPEKLTLYSMTDEMLPPQSTTWEFPKDDSWQKEIDDFIWYIENDFPILSGNLYDALRVLKIVDKVYKR